MTDLIKCSKCGCKKLEKFYSNNPNTEIRYKLCDPCRAKHRENRKKNKCEHGKEKSQCKPCGGSQICEHGKNKSYCKPCGGSAFCEHGKEKATCKPCGGSKICEHGKIKTTCKPCGGSSVCEHGVQKAACKPCGGSAFCEHGIQKARCKPCGGSALCEHGKRKTRCKPCGGSEFCEHGKLKSQCKPCGGSAICEHGKRKTQCYQCGDPKNFCKVCKFTDVRGTKGKITEGFCIPCFSVKYPEINLPRRYKLKENHMVESLKDHFPDVKFHFDKTVKDGCSRRRPDVRIEKFIYTIIIECDENRHLGYDEICDNKRTMEIFQDLGDRPVIFIRFNPDKYTEDGETIPSCFDGTNLKKREWNKRIKELVKTINKYYTLDEIPEKEITMEYLFY